MEPIEHLAKHRQLKPRIFLCCLLKETREAVAGLERREIDEIPRFRATEDGKYLVGCKFFSAQDQPEASSLGWKETGVRSEVDDGFLAPFPHDEPGEAMSNLASLHLQAGGSQGFLQCWKTPVDGLGRFCEEVKVPGEAIHVPTDDEGGASGEGEVLGLGQVSHNGSDANLQLVQHDSWMPRCCQYHSAQARRTRRGRASSSQSSGSSSRSMKRRMSSSLPSLRICS